MLQVDNFLIVFSLEVGGQFIGWFGLITTSIVLPLCVVGLIGLCIDRDLKFFLEQLERFDVETCRFNSETAIKQLWEYLLFTLILVIIMSAVYLVASALLIRGTINRKHRQIKPAKNILAFLAIFSVFGMLARLSVNSMLNTVLYVYVFAVIHSLWRKIKTEEESGERRMSAQYLHPIVVLPKV